MIACLPDNEAERLAALHEHCLLDTPPEGGCDDLVQLAAYICDAPIATVTLLDAERQWFKAAVGLPRGKTPREAAFCAHTILGADLLIVPDARADPRFADNPLVTGDPYIRFYAGVPLITGEGHALGALCVIDRVPRRLTPEQQSALRALGRQACAQLKMGRGLALQERLAAIVESSHDAIKGKNLDGIVTSWNPAAERLYGYSAAEMIGRPMALLLPPDRPHEVEELLARIVRGERIDSFTTVRLAKDGTRLDILLKISPIRDRDGKVIGASSIAQDISERKRAEERLRLLAAAVEHANDVVLITEAGPLDPPGPRIVYVNDTFTRMTGYTSEEVLGKTPRLLQGPGTDPATLAFLRGKLAAWEPVTVELLNYRKDGTPFWSEIRIRPLADESGWYTHWVAIQHDITERKAAERTLQESEARFRTSVDAMEEGITLQGVDGAILLCNESAERILGLSADQMQGRTSMDPRWRAIREDGTDFPGDQHPAMVALREGTPQRNIVMGVQKPNGALTSINVNAVPLLHEGAEKHHGVVVTFTDITERRQQEKSLQEHAEQLRRSEASLRAVLESAPIILYAADAAGIVTLSEGTGLTALGLRPGEVVGRSVFEFSSGDAEIEGWTRRALAGEAVTYDANYGGLSLHTELRPVRDGAGTVTGFIGVCFDITERKQAEVLLAESRQRLALATESAQIGIWDWDVTENKMLWDVQMYALYGIREQDFSGAYDAWRNGLHPEDRERAEAEIAQVLAGSGEFHTQFRVAWPSGEVRHIEAHSIVQRSGDGTVLRMTGVNWDITDRKRLEADLRERAARLHKSEERLAEAQRVAKTGSWDYDLMSGKITWSPALFGLIGWDPALGEPDYETNLTLYRPEDAAVLAGLVSRAAEFGEDYHIDLRLADTGGPTQWRHAVGSVIRDEAGRVVRLTGTLSDITDRKALEEALRERAERLQQSEADLRDYGIALEFQKEQLEEAAYEMTSQNEALARSRDEAQAATRAKSEFLANMSHEIRTPMNGVIGMAGLLLETPLTGEQRDYAETIHRSGDALLTIINDILDFSKMEAGKLVFEISDFSLREALEETAELMVGSAQAKGLELFTAFAPGVPEHLRGDAGRIRQVLTNFMGNALKFTERGEVVLEAALVSETPTEATVRLSVRDTGVGIAPERLEAIFESFTQEDGSITRRYGGTGLGLTISRHLVTLMGGRIGVESDRGIGSVFWAELTLEKATSVFAIPAVLPDSLRNRHALIVDDSAVNRRILREQLRSWGLRTVEAGGGGEALAAMNAASAASDPFGLVFLDRMMPDMDGEQTARAIQADPRWAGVPLILLSSWMRFTAEEARAKGFAVALVNPVRQSTLFNALMDAFADGMPAEKKITGTAAGAETELVPLGLRVLIAEDNSTNQKLALRLLQKWGCRADAVANGREALAALATLPYDLVLMDMQMPEMDGLEATRLIRHREELTGFHIPIIAMTANAMTADRDLCLAAGMDDYISKPIKPVALYGKIAALAPKRDTAPRG